MAYAEKLAARVRKALAGHKGLSEKRMFGGMAFMLRGKMCCGVLNDDLVVRVGPERYERALSRAHVRPMDFTGRPLKGYVFVGPEGLKTKSILSKWVGEAIDLVSSLPGK